MSIF
ncbi:UNVERIFIED_CONTAM: hypothetical protein GTU68_051531 [Idotea baltica]|jgi:hypothetical protein